MSIFPSAPSFWKRPRAILVLYGLLESLTLVTAVSAILSESSAQSGRPIASLSLPWLLLGGFGLLTSLLFAGFAIKAWRNPTWADHAWATLFTQGRFAKWILWASGFLFALAGILVLTPSYRFQLEVYFIRLYPFIVWLAFFSGLTLLLSLLAKFEFQPLNAKQALRSRSQALLIALGVFLFGLLLWGARTWISLSTHYEEYSYGAGVPVLGSQILLALTAAMIFHYLERRGLLLRFKRADLWIGLVLWSVTALLWVRQPITLSYFNPGPYPPNQEYYPFSDASLFDLGSQSLLIGEGLNFHIPYERPFYMQFLAFLHLAVGQNYSDVMSLQAALFAILAVLLYLIGAELAGRPLGIGLGILVALRGLNSIVGASIIDLSSPKQMLTDFPAAVGLALLAYLTIKWIKRPCENRLFVFWAGGLIGLLSLIRTNALLMIFPIALLAFIVYRHRLRAAFALTFILFAMVFVSIYPWGVSSNQSILEVYFNKFRTVLEVRYHFQFPKPDTLNPGSSALMAAPIRFQPKAVAPSAAKAPGPGFIVQGLYNNLLTSFLTLPASPQFHDLRYAVKVAFPFWSTRWDETFTPSQTFFLLLQFGLFSLGVGMAWKRRGLAGLTPLLIFFTYQLSNTLGRTSGGRYIVPVDWVVLVYYLLGFIEVIYFVLAAFSKADPSEGSVPAFPSDRFAWAASYNLKMAGILALFILIGLTPSLTGAMFSPRYTEERKAADIARLQADGYFQVVDISPAQLKTFLEQPAATLIYGRALYPRLYRAERGELDTAYPYLTLPYPRLAFKLLNANGNTSILFPTAKIPYFPNASDALVLGCQVNGANLRFTYVDALVVFLVEENGEAAVYARHPVAPLQCPAPPVICKGKQCRSGD